MFKGYIEGYYSRRLAIDAFKDLKVPISHYFYGPKEDIYLRHRWKELDKNLNRRTLPKKIKQVYCVSPTSEFFKDGKKNLSLLKRKIIKENLKIEKDLKILNLRKINVNKIILFELKKHYYL